MGPTVEASLSLVPHVARGTVAVEGESLSRQQGAGLGDWTRDTKYRSGNRYRFH